MLHKIKIIAPVLSIVIVGGFILHARYISLQPQLLIAPQKNEVSSDAQAGDTEQAVVHAAQKSNSTRGTPPAPPSTIASNIQHNAPKQAAIAQTITEEYVYRPLKVANDPGFGSAWSLSAMRAPAAWDITTGVSTVVAVIDTGFSLNHEDLANSWYENSGETGTTQLGDYCWTGTPINRSTNNCDDDQNGYVDDWRGWNFVMGDNNPMAGRENPAGDGVSHGTETAGLVGAEGDNGIGVATLNWSAKIIPLQALSDDGPGYTSDIAAAIYYAVDSGADVINMSLGGADYDPALKLATDYAYANDVVVVAAAGNCGTGTEDGCAGLGAGFIGYPAKNPHVISVGATDSTNTRASFSSYGPALDVVAPGAGAINTPTWVESDPDVYYTGAIYGTSYASPYVASLASLIKAVRPASTADDITSIILGTAQKVSAMGSNFYVNQYGHGLVDAQQALIVAQNLNSISDAPTLDQAGSSKSEHSFATNSSLASGCTTVVSNTYCSVWMQQAGTGYDRYLPYRLTGTTPSVTSWSWPTNSLSPGSWTLRALQGELSSPAYYLSSK